MSHRESEQLRLSIASEHLSIGASWQRITLIIIANFIGVGVLSMPHAASLLGWAPFGAFLVFMIMGSWFSGNLYAQLYIHSGSNGRWGVLPDAAYEAFGRAGEICVRTAVYVYMFGVCVVFHLTCTGALADLFFDLPVCKPYWAAAVAGSVVIMLQVRQMRDVGIFAAVGVVTIVVPCVIILVKLLAIDSREPLPTQWVATNGSVCSRGPPTQ